MKRWLWRLLPVLLLFAAGSQHDDRYTGLFANRPADILTGHIGEHEIQQDEVDVFTLKNAQGIPAVSGGKNGKSFALQVGFHNLQYFFFIIHN